VRAGLGSIEVGGVFVERVNEGIVMALAEEIGFADGFFGKWRIESEQRLS
jgi:hypothetical protein